MKRAFILLVLITLTIVTNAQTSGPGISYTYDNAGNRSIREYVVNIVYKPGREPQVIDTVTYQAGNVKEKVEIRTYPNPTKDIIVIENLNWLENNKAEIALFDANGKKLSQIKIYQAKGEIDLKRYPSATYYIEYLLDTNIRTFHKIVKL